MEKHPLQYFKDLILRNRISTERLQFLMNPDFSPVIKRDVQNDLIEYAIANALEEDGAVKVETVTFASQLEAKIGEEMFNALDQIDNVLLYIDDEKKQALYLKTLYKTLNSLILYAEGLEHLNKYIFIASSLKVLKAELEDKYNVQDDTTAQKQINLSTTGQSSKKLQWLGRTNILTTLFYDLVNGVRSNKIPPLIKATSKEIELFIVNNFIDKDGNPFTLNSTVNTNLKPNKQFEKRAKKGDSIDLDSYYKPE